MTATNSTWHLLGSGSIGCLFAAYLRRADIDVQLILRDPARIAQLRQRGGITLERDGEPTLIDARGSLPNAIDQPIERLLICTKAQQTRAALQSIQSRLAVAPLLILLQNGMGVRESLLELIPDATILQAITTNGAYQRERFHVVHAGSGDTAIGALDAAEQQCAIDAVKMLQCELPMATATDIQTRLWLKLAINSVINPLTAIKQCRNGELLNIPDIERRVAILCEEFIEVAAAEGQTFSPPALQQDIFAVMRATASNRSSMLQDILAARPTEIDFINGFIIKLAVKHRIACPAHIELFDAVKHKEHAFS